MRDLQPGAWHSIVLRHPLSPREMEVLALTARGLTTGEIAAELGISQQTAKNHRHSMQSKLGASCTAHAVAIGFERGLLNVERGEHVHDMQRRVTDHCLTCGVVIDHDGGSFGL